MTQQIVSTDTVGEKKYSTASVGTPLSLTTVCGLATAATVAPSVVATLTDSTDLILPSGSTAVPSSLICHLPASDPACAATGAMHAARAMVPETVADTVAVRNFVITRLTLSREWSAPYGPRMFRSCKMTRATGCTGAH